MERIQAAINKARETRQSAAAAAPQMSAPSSSPFAAPAAAGHSGDVAAAWAALEQAEARPKHLERNRIVTMTGGPEATAFDVLRTRLRKQMAANGWRRLAVTSPGGGCGKSTLCVNLAFAMARQAELRTLVVEADLRRPSLARILGLRARHSFAEVLAGRAPAEDHLARFGANLAFGTNTSPSRNASELLQAPQAAEALDRIEKIYAPDLVIFDLPPMLVSDDTLAFLGQVDCTLLVAAAGATTVDQVDACERDLAEHTNVLGVILNKCRYVERQGYGYEYYG